MTKKRATVYSYLVDLEQIARQQFANRKLGQLLWRRCPTYKALLSNDDFYTNPVRGRRQEAVEQSPLWLARFSSAAQSKR